MSLIWDPCNSLTQTQRIWKGMVDAITIQPVVDTSVLSPVGGSVRGDSVVGQGYNIYLREGFSPTNPYGPFELLLDLRGPNRPSVVYVVVSATAIPINVSVLCVTRPGVSGWIEHVVAPDVIVQPGVLTAIPLDYSGMSDTDLQNVAAFEVVAEVRNQAASLWVAGITSGAAPVNANLTASSSPSGTQFTLDGQVHATPYTGPISPNVPHTLVWQALAGYNLPTPASQTFTPTEGQNVNINGVYARITRTVSIESNVTVPLDIDGVAAGNTPVTTQLADGSHVFAVPPQVTT